MIYEWQLHYFYVNKKIKVAISLVMWHLDEKKYIDDALKSISLQTYENYDLFFTLNGLDEGLSDYITSISPEIKIIKHGKNLGYASAHQKILELAFEKNEYDAVVVQNLDILVDKHWLEELVKTANSNDSIGLIQPTILIWEDGASKIVNSDGGKINFLGFSHCGNFGKELLENKTDRQISFTSGCSMYVKKGVYNSIGGFDPDFFIYHEDIDLSLRAFLLGYRSYLSAKSVLWHKYNFKGSVMSSSKFYLIERNRYSTIIKNYGLKSLILISPALMMMEFGVLVYAVLNGFILDKIRADYDALKVLPKTLKKRFKIQKMRKVTDKELFELFCGDLNFPLVQHPLLTMVNPIIRTYFKIISYLL